MNQPSAEKMYKSAVHAWTMYDCANAALATTIMGAILPTYCAGYVAQGHSVPIWGNAVAIGSLIATALPQMGTECPWAT